MSDEKTNDFRYDKNHPIDARYKRKNKVEHEREMNRIAFDIAAPKIQITLNPEGGRNPNCRDKDTN